MPFVVSSQTTTPDSLKNALQKATSERSRLEILTNLMDISRNDDILVNAKQLYQEALKANDNYYKEAALTEILRYYINTDQTDSANAYIAKAEQELKRRSQNQPSVIHENDPRYARHILHVRGAEKGSPHELPIQAGRTW